jgi:hypothetical protein
VLTRTEQFSRLLRGCGGVPARLTAALSTALPAACAAEAADLGALILDCLQPRESRRPALAAARERFAQLERRLAADVLVRHWRQEHRDDVVNRLLEADRPPEPAEPPCRTWYEEARRRLDRNDFAGALDAAWNAIRADGPSYFRLYLVVLQSLAARLPRPQDDVRSGLERLTREFGGQLDEGDRLLMAHLRARYLGALEADLGRLDGPYQSRWNEGASCILRAWLQLRRGHGFNRVSQLCGDGRQRFEKMPGGGEAAGGYARAYLHLLDGIAHILYVAAGNPADYYIDALEHLTHCFRLATQVGADDLLRSCCGWLERLAWLTRAESGPTLRPVRLGARAILDAQGFRGDGSVVPEVPPYDETILFPL